MSSHVASAVTSLLMTCTCMFSAMSYLAVIEDHVNAFVYYSIKDTKKTCVSAGVAEPHR